MRDDAQPTRPALELVRSHEQVEQIRMSQNGFHAVRVDRAQNAVNDVWDLVQDMRYEHNAEMQIMWLSER